MSPEDRLLVLCTRQRLSAEHKQRIGELLQKSVRWDLFFKTASSHGVAPLVYHALKQCPLDTTSIPEATLTQFQNSLFQNMSSKQWRLEQLDKALDLFEKLGIDVMLVKGVALDFLVYESPYLTVSDDIDVILRVKPEELSGKDKNAITHHLHQKGIEFDFYSHHDVNLNGGLSVDFDRIWREARPFTICGHEVYVMSDEDMLLASCVNSCRKRYFRLKSVSDIAQIIKTSPDIDWEAVFSTAIREKSNFIVYAALIVCHKLLGQEVPARLAYHARISRVRSGLINAAIIAISKVWSLSYLYPFKGPNLFGRQVNVGLLLPYVSYRHNQVNHQIREAMLAWKHSDMTRAR